MATIPKMLLGRLSRNGEATSMYHLEGGQYVGSSWRQAAVKIASVAWDLSQRGIVPGDRVAILGGCHPDWVASDLAVLCLGAITVGLYPTSTLPQLAFQLRDGGVRILLVEGEAGRWEGLKAHCPALEAIVSWADLGPSPPPDADWFRKKAEAVRPEDTCAIVYTSGTTGDPKGAVLTHGAIYATCLGTQEHLPLLPGERSLCFLPLAHSLQRIGVYRALLEDVVAYFCPSLEQLREILLVARPGILLSVPRLLEKMKSGIEGAVAALPPRRQKIFAMAMAVGRERSERLERGEGLPPLLRLKFAMAEKLVFRKVKMRMGGELRVFACGGAALDPEVARFFHSMGVTVLEGWGLTETCAPATMNRPDAFRFGSVGLPLRNTRLKLDEDGEVLVTGPGLFSGYWNNPEATAAAFREDPDGRWFRTGDVGVLDADGFLRIVDRKKEILVTAGGKNVPPVNVERRLQGGAVGQAVVVGDGRPYLVALLAPDPENPGGDLQAAGKAAVERANQELAPYEQVKRWAWLPGPLTVEDGTLTPTLKLKRRVIAERYKSTIEALYQ